MRHPRQSAARFTGRARSYARFRSSYPREVVETLCATSGWAPSARVADVGAGTGIFTGLLLDVGLTVYAVEPNAAMRQEAARAHRHRSGFHLVAGSAEQTTLVAGSVDGITCAQSFHWFDLGRTVPEFTRILRPGGVVGLIWREPRAAGNEFHSGFQAALRAYGQDGVHPVPANGAEESVPQALSRVFDGARVDEYRYESRQELTLADLTGMVDSLSYTPPPGSPAYADLTAEIETLFAANSTEGVVQLSYDIMLFCIRPDW